jgi:hypothetical protein
MNDAKRKELRALHEAATLGPWKWNLFPTVEPVTEDAVEGCFLWNEDADHIVLAHNNVVCWNVAEADRAFIAAARTALPELLDAYEYVITHPFQYLKALGFEVDETGIKKQQAYEHEIVVLEQKCKTLQAAFDEVCKLARQFGTGETYLERQARVDNLKKSVDQ